MGDRRLQSRLRGVHPERRHACRSLREGRHLDFLGQLLANIALGTVSFGFIEGPAWGWHSWPVMACFATALASSVLFVVVERWTRAPLVPLSIFRDRAFSAAVADAALMKFGMYGLRFLL